MSFQDGGGSRRAQLFDGREEEKDFSDLATKEALKHLYEAREVRVGGRCPQPGYARCSRGSRAAQRGVETLAALNDQGERMERMQAAADRMHSKLDETEKALKDMESAFGFFRPSKRRRPPAFASAVRQPLAPPHC